MNISKANPDHSFIRKVEDGSKSPEPENSLEKEITTYVCEVLRICHALKEFTDLYSNPKLALEFLKNSHQETPCYVKIQQGFNALWDKVKVLKKANPKVKDLFYLMIKYSVKTNYDKQVYHLIEKKVEELIGEAIIKDHPFKKHGIVCIEDNPLLDIKLPNLLTRSKLNKLIQLKESIFGSKKSFLEMNCFKKSVLHIKGNSTFSKQVVSDFEKLLTMSGGKKLAKLFITHKANLFILNGSENIFFAEENKITLNNKPSLVYGYFPNKIARIITPPYITLGHELLHALHYLEGNFEDDLFFNPNDNKFWTNKEEKNTIGKIDDGSKKLTENGFISETFHLPRIYHKAPASLDCNLYTIDEKINELLLFDCYRELSLFLRKNELSKEKWILLTKYAFSNFSPKYVEIVLNSRFIEEIFEENKDYFFKFIHLASSRKDLHTYEKLILKFPKELEKLEKIDKHTLLINSLEIDPKITQLLVENNFHESALEYLDFYAKQTLYSLVRLDKIEKIIENKELFEITNEDLSLILQDVTFPEIREIFKESILKIDNNI